MAAQVYAAPMSDLLAELLSLERQGAEALTSGGAASFYGALLTDDALMVVPGFIVDKAMFVQSVDSEASWTSFTVAEPRLTSLTPDAAILVYRARGRRTGRPDYVALMSSVYVKRDGQWRLVHHQQTPQP
jgi:Domain of unknown function (DUF4440)